LNSPSWTPQETDALKAEWDSSSLPAQAFALKYAKKVARSADAIRIKVGALVRDGILEPHEKLIAAPKILLADIETLPIKLTGHIWRLHDAFLGPEHIEQPTCVVAWAATWLYSGKILSDVLKPKEAIARDDKRILQGIWALLEEADLVIAQNGKSFDKPVLNGRFIFNGFDPPSQYRVIDTYKDLKPNVSLDSFKQDYLSWYLGSPRKLHTDMSLWLQCCAGDPKALADMQRYNRRDVLGLESNYSRLMPWIENHPDLGAYTDQVGEICRVCGGEIKWQKNRRAMARVRIYNVWRCRVCGAVGRGRFSA
jgi:hypothetical protein